MSDPFGVLIAKLEATRTSVRTDTDNVPRTMMLEAVDAVHRYLADRGVDATLRAPLLHLIGAMQDLEAGRTSPALSRGAFQDAGQVSLQMDVAEYAMAAAAVTFLSSQRGVSVESALSKMSDVIGCDTKELREFRKNVRKGRANAVAIQEHNEWLLLRHRFKIIPAAEFVEMMIDKAKKLHIKKG